MAVHLDSWLVSRTAVAMGQLLAVVTVAPKAILKADKMVV